MINSRSALPKKHSEECVFVWCAFGMYVYGKCVLLWSKCAVSMVYAWSLWVDFPVCVCHECYVLGISVGCVCHFPLVLLVVLVEVL